MALKWIIVTIAIAYGLYQRYTAIPVPGPQGSCTKAFKLVENKYREGFTTGSDRGSSLAIYHKGELVCDMWGGWADETNKLPWTNDTVTIVFSTTKGVSSIAFALLYERGLFDYNDLVSQHWPEFAQNGKEKVTIAQLLSHQAGLAAIDETILLKDIRENPEKVSRAIEQQKPNWEPGTSFGYHALSFTLLVDQLVRRIDPDQRSLDIFFKEEIAEPYDIDFNIGLPLEHQWRSARIEPISDTWYTLKKWLDPKFLSFLYNMIMKPDEHQKRSTTNPEFKHDELNHPMVRLTPLGSALGSGPARAVAKLYSIASDPEKQLLSQETLKVMTTPQTGTMKERFYGLSGPIAMGVWINKFKGKHDGFCHPGYGGQLGEGIPDVHIGWSYITNYLGYYPDSHDDHRIAPIYKVMAEATDEL